VNLTSGGSFTTVGKNSAVGLLSGFGRAMFGDGDEETLRSVGVVEDCCPKLAGGSIAIGSVDVGVDPSGPCFILVISALRSPIICSNFGFSLWCWGRHLALRARSWQDLESWMNGPSFSE